MNSLIAILLYMQLIQSPGTYQQEYINQLNIQYQYQIQMIQNDSVEMAEVNSVYLPQAQQVIVISWPQESHVISKANSFATSSRGEFNYLKKQN